MRLRLFAVILACLFSSPALANVIYDVTVDYSGSGHTFRYSFTMEFAVAPPPAKSQGELLSTSPPADFGNEKLVVDGVELAIFADHEVRQLFFDGTVLTFENNLVDAFTGQIVGVQVACGVTASDPSAFSAQLAGGTITCNAAPGSGFANLQLALQGEVAFAERLSAVPAAPTLALLVMGLAGLRLSRGSYWSQRNT